MLNEAKQPYEVKEMDRNNAKSVVRRQAIEAVEFYVSAFHDSKVLNVHLPNSARRGPGDLQMNPCAI
jgi:predicted 3-demethylubiquinone-9 3-methyltransferase (glyoxalase superfamily)